MWFEWMLYLVCVYVRIYMRKYNIVYEFIRIIWIWLIWYVNWVNEIFDLN